MDIVDSILHRHLIDSIKNHNFCEFTKLFNPSMLDGMSSKDNKEARSSKASAATLTLKLIMTEELLNTIAASNDIEIINHAIGKNRNTYVMHKIFTRVVSDGAPSIVHYFINDLNVILHTDTILSRSDRKSVV